MYDPEEYEYEPQEHDELAVKILELIKAEVNAKIGVTVTGLEQSKKNETNLYKKINELQTTIRNFEPEMKKAILEKEKEVKRELFGGFTVGDPVYYANTKSSSVSCVTCGGTHKILVVVKGSDEERKIDCNKCDYGGKIYTYTSSPSKSKIRSVHLEMNETNKWISFYLTSDDRERKLGNVFKTEEDCQIHCDESNKPKEVAV